jgi:hypothetical protein
MVVSGSSLAGAASISMSNEHDAWRGVYESKHHRLVQE